MMHMERYGTLYYGKVLQNKDDKHPNQLKVRLRTAYEDGSSEVWARFLTPYGGTKYGQHTLPEIESEVLVAFVGAAGEFPVVLGCVYVQEQDLPEEITNKDNLVKVLRTKGGNVITANDEEGKASVTVKTAGGLTLCMEDEKQLITIQDSSCKNQILINEKDGSITVQAAKTITLKIGEKAVFTADSSSITEKNTKITLQADSSLEGKGAQMKLSGQTIDVSATAQANISSNGVTQVKGSILKLNG